MPTTYMGMYFYRGITAQGGKKMAKSRIFYWTSVVLRIGIVIQNLIDSRGIGGELLRALMSTFFKHCVLRAEQRSAFLQVSFTYAKIFLAAFVKKRKKKEKRRRSPGQFHFFPNCPKMGLILFSRH